MTEDGWRKVVERAQSDAETKRLLVTLLTEQDKAKSRLQEQFSCTGRPWADLVDDVLEAFGLAR